MTKTGMTNEVTNAEMSGGAPEAVADLLRITGRRKGLSQTDLQDTGWVMGRTLPEASIQLLEVRREGTVRTLGRELIGKPIRIKPSRVLACPR